MRPGAERRAVRRKEKKKKQKTKKKMEERQAVSPFVVCFYSAIVPSAASTSTLTELYTQWRSGADEEEEEICHPGVRVKAARPAMDTTSATNFRIKAVFGGSLLSRKSRDQGAIYVLT